ncbi:MAG TPA: HigA family addiction module antitoxin [Rectinemataceae bacterium]|nr:HigA family addiction module antitoxin [Rectinemataceae bacterium]
MNSFVPDYAIHPGFYLEELLESRGILKSEFADRAGLSAKAVSQIINRKALFSPEVALQFEKALGVDAGIWLGLAEAYQLAAARAKERRSLETEEVRAWVGQFPVSDLRKLGLLPKARDPSQLADGILRFLGLATPSAADDFLGRKAAAFRKSSAFSESPGAIAVWLRLAEQAAAGLDTADFDKSVAREKIQRMRDLTLLPREAAIDALRKQCSTAGIAFVIVPELKETHLCGAAFWAGASRAIVATSLRYGTNDHFWFTFFHEAAHLLLHARRSIFLDSKVAGGSQEEIEADAFARDTLIPEPAWQDFIGKNECSKIAIVKFAAGVRVHPGIVVGRLQHEKALPFSQLNELKERYTAEPAAEK